MVPSAVALLLASLALAGDAADSQPSAYEAARHISGKIGSRPEGGRGERRAHAYVAERFRAAGLEVGVSPFRVPGRRDSRNVIGRLDTPADCLVILMAHTDSVPPGLGAIDNASGVGVLVALAPELASLQPACDIWLVATGSEERQVTGLPYHAGAADLVRQVKAEGRADHLRLALSVDEVGLGKRFYLRSPQAGVREGVEGQVLAAARRAGVTVRWSRDSGSGNSDHREFELAGLPGAVLEVWKGSFPCHHMACTARGCSRSPRSTGRWGLCGRSSREIIEPRGNPARRLRNGELGDRGRVVQELQLRSGLPMRLQPGSDDRPMRGNHRDADRQGALRRHSARRPEVRRRRLVAGPTR